MEFEPPRFNDEGAFSWDSLTIISEVKCQLITITSGWTRGRSPPFLMVI